MNNNKKGLSTIVATLLIILLTLVAVGIIAVVVNSFIKGGSDQVELSAKCLESTVVATKVVNTTPLVDSINYNSTNYSVTLSRTEGEDVIGGVKLAFTTDEGSENNVRTILASQYPLPVLETITVTGINITLLDASKVDVTVFFLDSSGAQQLCKTPSQKAF